MHHARPIRFVSVIMPIRNEEEFIARSLGAVLEQDYPNEKIEVLVADGISTDNTRSIIERVSVAHPGIVVTIVDNPKISVPTGFNLALRRAKGEIIVRVDGHTIVSHDYVRQCVESLDRSGADNVGGRMDAMGETDMGKAVAVATSSPFGIGDSRFHYLKREEWVDTVYMGAWPRSVFERIGMFDEEMVRNQDDEFNYRIRARGGRILLSPTINSLYFNRTSLTSLWRQYFQYGYWKVRVLQKHPSQMHLRQLVPAFFVASIIAGGFISFILPNVVIGLEIVLVCYGAAALFISILTLRRHSFSVIARLPLVFGTLHFAYGFGFLTGLISFRGKCGRKRDAQVVQLQSEGI